MIAANGEGGFLYALFMWVVDCLTEFIPVSSTGHLIVTSAIFDRSDPSFEIAIQAGAITAILVLYWRPVLQAMIGLFRRPAVAGSRINLLWLLFVAALPAAIVGLLFEDALEFLFQPVVVATTLILGGLGFLWTERWLDRRAAGGTPPRELVDMSLRQALIIGVWQTLALVPGTSRSGATIVGGLLTGFSRTAAAEFSFLVGLPVLYGACGLKIVHDFDRFSGPGLPLLLIASAAAFVTALLIVGPFVRFLQQHTFRPFAYYRIIAGVILLGMSGLGYL